MGIARRGRLKATLSTSDENIALKANLWRWKQNLQRLGEKRFGQVFSSTFQKASQRGVALDANMRSMHFLSEAWQCGERARRQACGASLVPFVLVSYFPDRDSRYHW